MPEPALFFRYGGEEQAIGIESKAGLRRLAQAIHDAGVPVRLDGWQPNEEREFEKAFFWQADPQQVVSRARIETLPPDAASMMSVEGILLAIVRQSWAIVLWLLITAAAVYHGYQNWNNLGFVRLALVFIVPIGSMYLAAEFTARFASASTTRGLIRMAKSQLRKREGIQMNVNANDLIPVEIFAPDQLAKAVQKIRERDSCRRTVVGSECCSKERKNAGAFLPGPSGRWRLRKFRREPPDNQRPAP